jgi:hypothetical protein
MNRPLRPTIPSSTTESSPWTRERILDTTKADVLAMLNKDDSLRELLKETPNRIAHNLFQGMFLLLFRGFLSAIQKEVGRGLIERDKILRILTHYSPEITGHIGQQIFDRKAHPDMSVISRPGQVSNKPQQPMDFSADRNYR